MFNLRSRKAQDLAIQVHVLASRELRIESCAEFEQRGDAPLGGHPSTSRRKNPTDDLKDRTLARPIRPNDAKDLAAIDSETHVLQRPEIRVSRAGKRDQFANAIRRAMVQPV